MKIRQIANVAGIRDNNIKQRRHTVYTQSYVYVISLHSLQNNNNNKTVRLYW